MNGHHSPSDIRWRAGILLAFLTAAAVVASVNNYLISKAQNRRITQIEHTVRTIQREVVLTPCLAGDQAACRLFLDALLKAATPRQLARLRGPGTVTPGRAVQLIQQLAGSHPELFKPRPAPKPKPAPKAITAPFTFGPPPATLQPAPAPRPPPPTPTKGGPPGSGNPGHGPPRRTRSARRRGSGGTHSRRAPPKAPHCSAPG